MNVVHRSVDMLGLCLMHNHLYRVTGIQYDFSVRLFSCGTQPGFPTQIYCLIWNDSAKYLSQTKPITHRYYCLFQVVTEDLAAFLEKALALAVSGDEITVRGHTYFVVHINDLDEQFRRRTFHLKLARLTEAAKAKHLLSNLISMLEEEGGLDAKSISCKVVGASFDGASVNQGKHKGLIARVSE